MKPRPKFDWQGHTPPQLVEAVQYLRERYDTASWNIDQVTGCLCYGLLHTTEATKDLLDHIRAFEAMKPAAGRSMLARFATLYARACSPAYFAAFFGIREHLLRSQVEYTFQKLLSLAIVQRQLLPISPPKWANEQVESLINEEYWKTNNWIKRVCDVQRGDRDDVETEEEFVFGGSGGPPCCS